MAATYLGSFTVGGSLPGLSADFAAVGAALTNLEAEASNALATMQAADAAIDAQITQLGAAKAAIRIPAVARFEAELSASQALSGTATARLADPTGWLNTLIAGAADLQSRLAAGTPTASLNAQIGSANARALSLQARIDAIDAELAALDTISAALQTQANALASVSAALSTVITAAASALSAFAAMNVHLAVSGAHCFLYTGTLGGIGAAIDLVSGDTGLSASVNVRVPIVLVDSSDTDAVNAVDAVFRTS